jgi:hypothetical protein
MKFFISIILSLLSLFAIGQSQTDLDIINTSFLFPKKVAKDSSDLTFKVVFHNTSKKTAFAYSALVHGKLDDEDCNLNIVVQKFNGHDYEHYPLGYYRKMSETKNDSICRDITKHEWRPLSTDTLSYNLLMAGRYFESGKYRFKVHLRKSGKIILPKGDGDTWHSEIDYIDSKWFYFQSNYDIFGK